MPNQRKIRGGAITLLPDRERQKNRKWKGSNIFDQRYWILAICAKRRSGKTVLLSNLVRKFATRNTPVLIFSSTFYNDNEWKKLAGWLREKKIPYEAFTEIRSENGVDYVREFMNSCRERAEDNLEALASYDPSDEKTETKPEIPRVRFDPPPSADKKKKTKKRDPEPLIVFDDLSNDLRTPSVNRLLKNSRHFKCRIILSSQSVTDWHPHSFHQLDFAVLFKNHTEEELRKLYDRLDVWIPFKNFVDLYHAVTDKPFQFLLIDRDQQKFRRNLDTILG